MTPAERKANERARNKKAGLIRVEMKTYPECEQEIRTFATKITARALKRRATNQEK